MDLVYQSAVVTIVACAGNEPNHGLPGISNTARIGHTGVRMSGLSFASFPTYPWYPVQISTWRQRGWTFQEELFSRRRIYFTEEQMIFECCTGWICESVSRFRRSEIPGTHLPNYGIYHLIAEYCHRQLSYPHDILNAFQGVLRAFEAQDPPVRHHFGVPLLSRHDSYYSSFVIGLCWDSMDSHGRRREGFPSWSWVGWLDSKTSFYGDSPVATASALVCLLGRLSVSIERVDKSRLEWREFETYLHEGRYDLSDLSRFLVVQTWAVSGRCIVDPYTLSARLELRTGVSTSECFRTLWHWPSENANGPHVVEVRECTALALGELSCPGPGPLSQRPLLLIENKGDHWERLGIADTLTPVGEQDSRDLKKDPLPWEDQRFGFRLGEFRLG
jgi:hypothetical protein